MEHDVATHVFAHRAVNLSSIRIVPEVKLSQATLLVAADRHHGGRFLLVVDAKTSEETRYALEAKPGRLRAQSEVPIKCVFKTLVDRSHLVPNCEIGRASCR